MDYSSAPSSPTPQLMSSAPLRTAEGTPLQSIFPFGVKSTPAAMGETSGRTEFADDGDISIPRDSTRYLEDDVSGTSTNRRRRERDEIDDNIDINQRQLPPRRSSDRSNARQPPPEHTSVDYNTWRPTLDGESPFEHRQRTRRSETELREAAAQRAEYNAYLRHQESDSTTLAVHTQPVVPTTQPAIIYAPVEPTAGPSVTLQGFILS